MEPRRSVAQRLQASEPRAAVSKRAAVGWTAMLGLIRIDEGQNGDSKIISDALESAVVERENEVALRRVRRGGKRNSVLLVRCGHFGDVAAKNVFASSMLL